MAPLFAIGVGDVAVRSARALNAVLFASAALPVYLLAGFAFTGRSLTRVVVAVLAVFLPWVVLTSAMFTESLAYPLFLWAAYSLTRLYVKPSPGSDVFSIVVIALATVARTQLIALGIAYLVVVLMRTAHDLRTPGVPWYVAIDRLVVRRMPGAIVLAAGAALGLVWLSRAGTLTTHLNSLLGTYASTTTDQRTLPRDIGLSTGVELIGMAAGTGVLPVVAGALVVGIRGSRQGCASVVGNRLCSSSGRHRLRALRHYALLAELLLRLGDGGALLLLCCAPPNHRWLARRFGSAVPSATCGRQRSDSRVRCAPSASPESGRSRGELLRARTGHGAVHSEPSREWPNLRGWPWRVR